MRVFSVILFFAVLLCFGCSSGHYGGEGFVIMSWNVQNFFDDVDNGTEYREFDPSEGGWSLDCFNSKAAVLSDVIKASVRGAPDILLMQEVENENALRYLNDNYLKTCRYDYLLFLPTENSAVGCAVLSRIPILSVKNHSVTLGGSQAGRNISELHFSAGDGAMGLVVFVNHWKSKIGGAEATEPARIAAAELLSNLMFIASEASSEAAVIAAGDFNESHDESVRTGGEYPSAISLAEGGCIIGGRFYFNPWVSFGSGGSYFYDDHWETLDQFFLSSELFDEKGWEYSGFSTVVTELNSTGDGRPYGWVNGSSEGCSDHFPVILTLKSVD